MSGAEDGTDGADDGVQDLSRGIPLGDRFRKGPCRAVRADGDRGPHIVTIIVETPKNLSKKQKELLEEFKGAKKRSFWG